MGAAPAGTHLFRVPIAGCGSRNPKENQMKTIEYRVRPVTRYIVTRFEAVSDAADSVGSCGSRSIGEFDREEFAENVAVALAKAEPEGSVSFGSRPIDIYWPTQGETGGGLSHTEWQRHEVIREE
jgi:hypothetical protein